MEEAASVAGSLFLLFSSSSARHSSFLDVESVPFRCDDSSISHTPISTSTSSSEEEVVESSLLRTCLSIAVGKPAPGPPGWRTRPREEKGKEEVVGEPEERRGRLEMVPGGRVKRAKEKRMTCFVSFGERGRESAKARTRKTRTRKTRTHHQGNPTNSLPFPVPLPPPHRSSPSTSSHPSLLSLTSSTSSSSRNRLLRLLNQPTTEHRTQAPSSRLPSLPSSRSSTQLSPQTSHLHLQRRLPRRRGMKQRSKVGEIRLERLNLSLVDLSRLGLSSSSSSGGSSSLTFVDFGWRSGSGSGRGRGGRRSFGCEEGFELVVFGDESVALDFEFVELFAFPERRRRQGEGGRTRRGDWSVCPPSRKKKVGRALPSI
ncbi:hypothetical protein BDY24DRAFT_56432 [Mrakia frigida]|uniref:uncharacterized protein n=1 Tax=Mrakia frigida TaxID=29902 RepID=UPI003FCBF7EE